MKQHLVIMQSVHHTCTTRAPHVHHTCTTRAICQGSSTQSLCRVCTTRAPHVHHTCTTRAICQGSSTQSLCRVCTTPAICQGSSTQSLCRVCTTPAICYGSYFYNYYSHRKNNCQKIQPAHFMITKRYFILRGSCFCDDYFNISQHYHSVLTCIPIPTWLKMEVMFHRILLQIIVQQTISTYFRINLNK